MEITKSGNKKKWDKIKDLNKRKRKLNESGREMKKLPVKKKKESLSKNKRKKWKKNDKRGGKNFTRKERRTGAYQGLIKLKNKKIF